MRTRLERNGRTLELLHDADGGGLLVQDDEPARQSVYLTPSELRWLLLRGPLIVARSWWLRDGGGFDRFTRTMGRDV